MSYIFTTEDPYRGMKAEVAPAEVDEFAAYLSRAHDEAAAVAEKAGAVAQKAADDHARANERLYAIRAAAVAYEEASRQRMPRPSEGLKRVGRDDV